MEIKYDANMFGRLMDYSARYEITFQMWPTQYTIYVRKDGVALYDFGSTSPNATVHAILEYLDRINQVTKANTKNVKAPVKVYVSKRNWGMYPLSADGTKIDMDNPLTGIQLPKYRQIGENNQFNIYELKPEYRDVMTSVKPMKP